MYLTSLGLKKERVPNNGHKGVSDKFLAQGYKMKGVFFLLASDYENSSIWYKKALELAKMNKDKNGEACIFNSRVDIGEWASNSRNAFINQS